MSSAVFAHEVERAPQWAGLDVQLDEGRGRRAITDPSEEERADTGFCGSKLDEKIIRREGGTKVGQQLRQLWVGREVLERRRPIVRSRTSPRCRSGVLLPTWMVRSMASSMCLVIKRSGRSTYQVTPLVVPRTSRVRPPGRCCSPATRATRSGDGSMASSRDRSRATERRAPRASRGCDGSWRSTRRWTSASDTKRVEAHAVAASRSVAPARRPVAGVAPRPLGEPKVGMFT